MPERRGWGDPALLRRIASATVLAAAATAAVLLGGWSFITLVMLALALMAWEWSALVKGATGRSGTVAGGAALLVTVAAAACTALGAPQWGLVVLLVGAALAWLGGHLIGVAGRWAGLGVVYLGLPAVALIWLDADPELGRATIIWLLVVVWSTDTMAYVVGRKVGGPRLAPAISPGKTWSGLCGGILGAAVAGSLLAAFLDGQPLYAAGLGAALAVVAQLGDLAESKLKRRAAVKDSSALIPGHGGVLDRVDGLMIAAPVLALVALLFGGGALLW